MGQWGTTSSFIFITMGKTYPILNKYFGAAILMKFMSPQFG